MSGPTLISLSGNSDMEFLREYVRFLKSRKKLWLLPLIVMLLLFGALLAFSGAATVSPFIYTLF